MRRLFAGCAVAAMAFAALTAPAGAEASGCPSGGGWETWSTDGEPGLEANDRNGDGFVCVRFYDNEHVPHRAAVTDNRAG